MAAEKLVSEVARLCALSHLPEEVAVRTFREAYRSTASDGGSQASSRSEPFAAAQVLSEWHQNTLFMTADGGPAQLSLSNGEFAKLCSCAASYARPDRLLEILSHAGAIQISGDHISATRRELILGDTHPASVARAVSLSAEFVATLIHNLTRKVSEPSRFERTVVSDKISSRNVSSLLAYLSVHGQAFLEDLDSWMSAREESATSDDQALGVGVYLFVREGHKAASTPTIALTPAMLAKPAHR